MKTFLSTLVISSLFGLAEVAWSEDRKTPQVFPAKLREGVVSNLFVSDMKDADGKQIETGFYNGTATFIVAYEKFGSGLESDIHTRLLAELKKAHPVSKIKIPMGGKQELVLLILDKSPGGIVVSALPGAVIMSRCREVVPFVYQYEDATQSFVVQDEYLATELLRLRQSFLSQNETLR